MTARESRPSLLPGWAVDETAEARCAAIAALPPPVIEEHLEALLELLRDQNWRVRREAALAIARVSQPEAAVHPLLVEVCSDDVLSRNAALEALRNMGSAVVEPVLARLATAEGPTRRFLVEAMLEGADARCVPLLRSLLDDPDGNVPPAATEVLGVIDGPEALDALGDAVERADPVVRLAALIAFEARGEVARWPAVSALVDDLVCGAHAVRALASQHDEASMRRVASALSSRHRRVALAALLACARIARLGGPRVAFLAAALRSSSSAVFTLASRAELGPANERVAALETLAVAADASTLDVVLRACGSRDAEVATAAEAALDSFAPELIPDALRGSMQVSAAVIAATMAWALRCGRDVDGVALTASAWGAIDRRPPPLAAWELIARFGSADDARLLTERVGRALASDSIEAGDLIPALDRALRMHRADVEPLIRSFVGPTRGGMMVASALVRAGLPLDRPRVEEGLESTDPSVRAAALRALGLAGDGASADVIDRARRDPDAEVRLAFAEALRAGKGDRVTLLSLAADREVDVALRAAAVAALAAQGVGDAALIEVTLRDSDPEVVLEGMRAFDSDVTPAMLARTTEHGDASVVVEALARLRERDVQAATARAAALLSHSSPLVRIAAARSLAGRSARTALSERLQHESDVDVRRAIDEALFES